MRRFYLIALIFFSACAARPSWAVQYEAIIIDAGSGKVLHAVNPDERAYPASLTKLMTLYLTFDALRDGRITFDRKLPVSARAQRRPPSKLGLRKGQTITVRQAVEALVTKSANDAATVLAEGLGGTEDAFARKMTAKAHRLGMLRTTFRNASGLFERGQVSTARDMAKLALALQRDFPEYYHFFSLKSFDYKGVTIRNHNHLLARYKGTDGMKTGYVHQSGFNIVVSVVRHHHRLIGVMFGGKSTASRDRHMMALLNDAYESIAEAPVIAKAAPAPPPVKPAIATAAAPAGVAPIATAVAAKSAKPSTALDSVSLARVKPAAVVDASADAPGVWAVQVGAFAGYTPAHDIALRAIHIVPRLSGVRVAVVPSRSGRHHHTLYRARLVGFEEVEARRACHLLKRKHMSCLVLRTSEEVAEGDR